MGADSSKVVPNSSPHQPSNDLHELMDPVEGSPGDFVMSTSYDRSSRFMADFLKFGDDARPTTPTSAPHGSSTQTEHSPRTFVESSPPRPSTLSSLTTTSTKPQSTTKGYARPNHLCKPCSRFFTTQEALESHWVNARRHNWCQRCDRFFQSTTARTIHCNNSPCHWICNIHNLDFHSKQDLYDHYQTVENHHCCDQCDKVFATASGLHNHSSNHNPQDIACWGCHRMFKKYSSMLAHLETDACTTTRVKLDLLAIECPYSKDYVRPGSEKHLRNGGRNMYYPKPVIHRGLPRRFRCSKCDVEFPTYGAMHRHLRLTVHHPLVYQCAGCEMQFADLSALVSHAESLACEEGLSKGTGSIAQLLRYLWLRLEK